MWPFRKKKKPREFQIPEEHLGQFYALYDAADSMGTLARYRMWGFISDLFPAIKDKHGWYIDIRNIFDVRVVEGSKND